jgi:hypothetical protein
MQNRFRTGSVKAGIFILLLFVFQPVIGKAPALTPKEITDSPPRVIRTCCSFGAGLKMGFIPFIKYTDITSPAEVGNHEYMGGKNEGNGIIYTQRGGFIDLGHLRDCADWTAWLYSLIRACGENPDYCITELGFEGGAKTLILNSDCEPDSSDAARLAGKIAYDLSLWHEIATWYGASLVPLLPERYSSFSPEDLYSNLLGVHLAVRALESTEDYNAAMTRLIVQTLDSLGAVTTRDETYAAMEKVENNWWTKEKPLPSKKILLKRFLGDENMLVPWLVPVENDDPQPCSLAMPENELNNFYRLEIKINFRFPERKIFGDKNYDMITQLDFDTLLHQIGNDIDRLDSKRTERTERQNFREKSRI